MKLRKKAFNKNIRESRLDDMSFDSSMDDIRLVDEFVEEFGFGDDEYGYGFDYDEDEDFFDDEEDGLSDWDLENEHDINRRYVDEGIDEFEDF